jgi:deoxyribonuclease IV
MVSDGRRLGAHLPLGTGMVKAVERAHEIGAEALQVFCDNPTAWRRRSSLPKELPAFRERIASYGIGPLAIHAPYLVNLAGDDPDFRERSISVLAHDLDAGTAYGAAFLNLHIGSHRGGGVDEGISALADGVRQVLDTVPAGPDVPRLVLENSAGGGYNLGSSIEELGAIDEALAAAGVDRTRVAYCLDAAHLWGAGYDVRDRSVVDDLLDAFDARIRLDRLVMVHLNDSRTTLGSRMDRHEHLGAGQIGPDGIRNLLTHPRLAHVAFLLETPGMDEGYDAINLARARDIAEGRPLDDLPPEAFTLRRSRSHSGPADEAEIVDPTVAAPDDAGA